MAKVTGIGGVFFKARDPKALQAWYREHLGIEPSFDGGTVFRWDEEPRGTGTTTWAPFRHDTTYFQPGTASFMINYRVDNLAALLAGLKARGIDTVKPYEESEFGKFAWLLDPEGTCIELWEPAEGM